MGLLKLNNSKIIQDLKNRPIRHIIRGGIMWGSVISTSILVSTTVLICYPIVNLLDKERHLLHKFANYWGKMIEFLNPWWTFNIYGRENLAPKNTAVIYVANHQSQADILALFIVNTRFRWLSKASLFKIPIFGWAMKAVGYVPVNRGNKLSAEKCMLLSAEHLKNGTPMIFFPEGTRSVNGELGQFKKGAFRLAKSMGIPIVPITINGCTHLLPKGSILPNKASISIHFHKAISPINMDIVNLMNETKRVIAEQLQINNDKTKAQ